MIKDIPIYNAVINVDDTETGMTAISLVDFPAVERNFIAFSDDKPKLKFTSDNTQHKITGVAIIANKPIYRNSPEIGEYYINFTPETIQTIVEKFAICGFHNVVNLQHNDLKFEQGVVMVEYFIKDDTKGVSPVGFEDIANGSLFVTYKINNPEIWDEITKDDSTLNGFSIEIFCDLEPQREQEHEPTIDEFVSSCLRDNFRSIVTKGNIYDAIKEQRQIEYEYNDKRYVGQIHSIGVQGGKDVVVIFNPRTEKWVNVPLDSMRNMVVSSEPLVNWIYNDSYDDVINDETITTKRTAIGSRGIIETAIDERMWCKCNYNDEKENPHTGSRQIIILAFGITNAGNECIRVLQRFGDSRTGEMYYKMMLTRRIKDLQLLDFMERWDDSVLDDNYNYFGDEGMSMIYKHYGE